MAKKEGRKKMFSMRVTDAQWDALVLVAAKEKTNVSELLRPQLDKVIETYTKQKAA